MKIYTKTGDLGQTSLVDGKKVSKGHLRLDTYGTADELNSHLGVLVTHLSSSPKSQSSLQPLLEQLHKTQNLIFNLGSQLACEDSTIAEKLPTLTTDHVQSLESWIDELQNQLPELKNFILPGGHPAAAQAHICRTVCRRLERLVVELFADQPATYPALPYLNRLSDYFFVISRAINAEFEAPTPQWTQ